MKGTPFFRQAELMLRLVPHVATERCFALKGGTAINFFLRDIPRLSVDIDLTYVPIKGREESLKNIGLALKRIAVSIKKAMPNLKIKESYGKKSKYVTKLFVSNNQFQIGIEPNQVIRGTVFPCETRDLSKKAEETFELSVSAITLSEAELYGSKICAALDRQHPRDLLDIKVLLDNEGITTDIRRAFVIYLVSHDRPMHEVIDPVRKDVRVMFDTDFQGMADEPVEYEALLEARERLINRLKTDLTEQEKKFILSIKEDKPEWALLGLAGIDKLPAIQWKLQNIRKMEAAKHQDYLRKLRSKLGL